MTMRGRLQGLSTGAQSKDAGATREGSVEHNTES
jgi:hypothetical protein